MSAPAGHIRSTQEQAIETRAGLRAIIDEAFNRSERTRED